MRHSLLRCAGGLPWLCLFLTTPLRATTLVLSDFDNTIIETRQERRGTFQTPFRLFRVERKVTVLEPELDGPNEIDVSPWDFERLKAYLAKSDSHLGAVSKQFMLQDGRRVRIGHYRLRNPESFEYFFPGRRGENYLLNNFIEAEKRTEGTFQGPFWEMMTLYLSHEESAKNFGIITARGHSRAEWKSFFSYLKKKRYVDHTANLDLIFGVGGREFEHFSLEGEIPKQKTGVLEAVAHEQNQIALREEDEKISADGKRRERLHTLIVADDNQETLERAIRKFQHMAQSRIFKIKFCVFNMGKATDIRNSGRPQYSVILPDGTFRQATRLEILGEPQALSPEMKAFLAADGKSDCRSSIEAE